VKIEFLPDPNCVTSIAKQIKATNRAYSLFDLARMFLAKPERHRVRITHEQPNAVMFQAGENGPVGLDRQAVERAAFGALKSQFYIEETIQRDPPKGNFANVARHRFTGILLGPTNHHGYQPALRKLYEERFSRRMSFPDFQREIEIVTDPGLIEQWKEQTRTKTVYRLRPPEGAEPVAKPNEGAAKNQPAETPIEPQEPQPTESASQEQPPAAAAESTPQEPVVQEPVAQQQPDQPTFESLGEVEQHFRKHHLESVIRSRRTFEIHGETSRALPDRRIADAVRQAWEKERGFPGQMMHHLRAQFSQANLHMFKHRKRMQFVTAVRPEPFSSRDRAGLTPNVAEILRVIETTPNCTRAKLAAAVLGQMKEDDAELPKRKAALAADLRWVIDAGRVIEFGDGTLELPFTAKPESRPAGETKGYVAISAPPDVEPAAEILGTPPAEAPEITATTEPAAAADDEPPTPEPDAANPPGEPPAISAEQSSAEA
jgi:hypothetical protein